MDQPPVTCTTHTHARHNLARWLHCLHQPAQTATCVGSDPCHHHRSPESMCHVCRRRLAKKSEECDNLLKECERRDALISGLTADRDKAAVVLAAAQAKLRKLSSQQDTPSSAATHGPAVDATKVRQHRPQACERTWFHGTCLTACKCCRLAAPLLDVLGEWAGFMSGKLVATALTAWLIVHSMNTQHAAVLGVLSCMCHECSSRTMWSRCCSSMQRRMSWSCSSSA